jgi:MFS family permease
MGAAARGLDYLNLFVANIQTGFGPFIAVYLATRGWTQTEIGVALSVGTVAAMASQIPAGALVDAISRKSLVAGASLLAFAASALLLALAPIPLWVYLAEILHGFSSCTLGPAIAAMSLALTGQRALELRFGRNARFSSIGNAAGAALMGAAGYYLSSRSVFFLTAAITLPAIATVRPLSLLDGIGIPRPPRAQSCDSGGLRLMQLLADRRLMVFAACTMLFTFANAAMLPIIGTAITRQAPDTATLLIAAYILLPQLVIALISTFIAGLARNLGRRPILILALAVVAVRGIAFATISNGMLLLPIQALDGISGACIGILIPLVTSDIAAHSGHYNLSLGIVGFAMGIGATLSTTLAGIAADHLGEPVALLGLAAAGLLVTLLALFAMPETRPESA